MATTREAVLKALAEGGRSAKIRAIKVYREMARVPLKEAKEAVEEIMADPRPTVQVRIAVAVDIEGKWCAVGWSGGDERHLWSDPIFDDYASEGEARYWLTAELPIPTVTEVEASVEGDGGE